MVDNDELMRLASIFDNSKTKVLGVLPKNIKLKEVVGIHSYPDKITKFTITRNGILYLCWVPTHECAEAIVKIKEEVKNNPDWRERWEPWELNNSMEPFSLRQRLIKSRLKNGSEFKEFSEGA